MHTPEGVTKAESIAVVDVENATGVDPKRNARPDRPGQPVVTGTCGKTSGAPLASFGLALKANRQYANHLLAHALRFLKVDPVRKSGHGRLSASRTQRVNGHDSGALIGRFFVETEQFRHDGPKVNVRADLSSTPAQNAQQFSDAQELPFPEGCAPARRNSPSRTFRRNRPPGGHLLSGGRPKLRFPANMWEAHRSNSQR